MLALKNLLRRKVRSLFAVLQIAVAIAAFVSIVGMTQGLRAQFYRISQVFAFDLIVQPEGVASPIFSIVTREEAAQVLAVDGVEGVSLMGIQLLRHEAIAQPIMLAAMDPKSTMLGLYTIIRGRGLEPGDRNQILVGEAMCKDLGIDASPLVPGGIKGQPPILRFEGDYEFEIVGLFEAPLKDVPFLSGQAIMSLPYFEETTKRKPNILIAHLEPGRRATRADEVREGLDRCKAIAPAVSDAVPRLKAKTIEDFLDSFKQAELIDDFAFAITALAALLSGIGVANTMLMSVFDRTREIGLLRAVGWSRRRIVLMIETEGVILAVCGGLIGLPLGMGLIQASKLLIKLGWLNVSLDLSLYVKAVAVAGLIGLVGSIYPALRAAYLQPTEALRYE